MQGVYKRGRGEWEAPNVKPNDRYNMFITGYTFEYVNANPRLFKQLNVSHEQNMKNLAEYETLNVDEAEEEDFEENGLLHL